MNKSFYKVKENLIKNLNVTKKVASFLIVACIFLVPVIVFASDSFGMERMSDIGLGDQDPRDTINFIIKLAMEFLGTIAVVLVLLGGFKWMMAMGDKEKIEEAKQTLFSGVVGLLIILSAYGLASFLLDQLLIATGY